MEVVIIILALVGIIAGAYAAVRSDAQAAGAAAVLIGFAVLLPHLVK